MYSLLIDLKDFRIVLDSPDANLRSKMLSILACNNLLKQLSFYNLTMFLYTQLL